jgi:type II secretory pathway pseudopilin PulG
VWLRRGTARASGAGYTFIEVMIVMGITIAMFTMATVAFRGQQGQAQFQQATRDAELKLRDTINDISTGYYPAKTNFTCTAGPTLSAAPSSGQGTNTACVFLGKVVHFGVNGDANCTPTCFNIYTIAGQRQSGGLEVQTIDQANPETVVTFGDDLTESYSLKFGATIPHVWLLSNAGAPPCPCDIGAVGFFSSLGKYDTDNNLLAGSSGVDVFPLRGTTLGQAKLTVRNRVTAFNAADQAEKNPARGILVCLRDSGGTRTSGIVIARNGRQSTVESLFDTQLDSFLAQFGGAVTCG